MSWYIGTIDRKKIQIGFTDIPRTDNADGSIGVAGVNKAYKSDYRPPSNPVSSPGSITGPGDNDGRGPDPGEPVGQYGETTGTYHGGSDSGGSNYNPPVMGMTADRFRKQQAVHYIGVAHGALMGAVLGVVLGGPVGAVLGGVIGGMFFRSVPPDLRFAMAVGVVVVDRFNNRINSPTMMEKLGDDVLNKFLDQVFPDAQGATPSAPNSALGYKIGPHIFFSSDFAALGRLIKRGGTPNAKQRALINRLTIAQRKAGGLFLGSNGNVTSLDIMIGRAVESVIFNADLATDQRLAFGLALYTMNGDKRGAFISEMAGSRTTNNWNRMRVNTTAINSLNAYKEMLKRAKSQHLIKEIVR